jgi:uncharacterized protein YqjF (DUF2071 family)
MRWAEAAFLHWRMEPREAAELVPTGLELDTFNGQAWVSAVAFWMIGARLLGFPLARARFPELNRRTYVTAQARPGIRFLCIDAPGIFVPLGSWQGMPYRKAILEFDVGGIKARPGRGAPFAATWTIGPAIDGGNLDRWLVERYAVYGSRGSRLTRADVSHPP